MAQLTLYIDDETAVRMRTAANAAGVSFSRWVADLVRQRTQTTWPAEVVALAGAWSDDDAIVAPRPALPVADYGPGPPLLPVEDDMCAAFLALTPGLRPTPLPRSGRGVKTICVSPRPLCGRGGPR